MFPSASVAYVNGSRVVEMGSKFIKAIRERYQNSDVDLHEFFSGDGE